MFFFEKSRAWNFFSPTVEKLIKKCFTFLYGASRLFRARSFDVLKSSNNKC